MKKILMGSAIFAILAFISFPYVVSMNYNLVFDSDSSVIVSDSSKVLHRSAFIADLHCDALLGPRDLNKRGSYGHVDLPRMQEGNMALQVFTVVTQTPNNMNEVSTDPDDVDIMKINAITSFWPPKTWNNNLERALHQSKKLHDFESESNRELRIIKNADDLRRLVRDRLENQRIVGGILGLEGVHMGRKEAITAMYKAGFRMMAPTHFFDSYMGGSAHGLEKGGLTTFGHEVIQKMIELNIALDLSHASHKVIDDVLEYYPDVPIIISHTGVLGTCDNMRNMTDHHLKAIAESGGVIGISFFPKATCGKSIKEIIDAIEYTVTLVGEDHVGLGSDYDGMVGTPFDVSEMSHLTQGLVDRGFSDTTIRKVLGENVLNYFLKVLPSE